MSAIVSVVLPLGVHHIGLRVTDSQGESAVASVTVSVTDTNLPRLAVEPSLPVLWPPDHRMERVPIAWVAHDRCDANPTVLLESVTSSEPDDEVGNGDGTTTGDIADVEPGSPDTEVLLRAERAGAGPGRVYTLIHRVTDASRNSAQGMAVVRVPHDLGSAKDSPVEHLEGE